MNCSEAASFPELILNKCWQQTMDKYLSVPKEAQFNLYHLLFFSPILPLLSVPLFIPPIFSSFLILCPLPPSHPLLKVDRLHLGREKGLDCRLDKWFQLHFLHQKPCLSASDTFHRAQRAFCKNRMFSLLGQISDLWNLQCRKDFKRVELRFTCDDTSA